MIRPRVSVFQLGPKLAVRVSDHFEALKAQHDGQSAMGIGLVARWDLLCNVLEL